LPHFIIGCGCATVKNGHGACQTAVRDEPSLERSAARQMISFSLFRFAAQR
jgi:hypothetical protein